MKVDASKPIYNPTYEDRSITNEQTKAIAKQDGINAGAAVANPALIGAKKKDVAVPAEPTVVTP